MRWESAAHHRRGVELPVFLNLLGEIILDANLFDGFKLGLDEIDVAFFRFQHVFKFLSGRICHQPAHSGQPLR